MEIIAVAGIVVHIMRNLKEYIVYVAYRNYKDSFDNVFILRIFTDKYLHKRWYIVKVRYGIMLICILVASLVSGCISGGGNGSDDGLSGTLAIAGSTTVQPIASAAAEVFMDLHPNVIVTIQGGGSGTGVTQAGQGVVDIGNASREVKASEYEAYPDLVATAVAADGIAVVVHPSNAIGTLTVEQIKGIFTGEITNWSQVGGADRTIVVVIREVGFTGREAPLRSWSTTRLPLHQAHSKSHQTAPSRPPSPRRQMPSGTWGLATSTRVSRPFA